MRDIKDMAKQKNFLTTKDTESEKSTAISHSVEPVVISEHSRLVLIAEKWMKKSLGCGITFREFQAFTTFGEIPDVIGWKHGYCIMVEVKASRADFLSDKRKRHRHLKNADHVLGHWRFYVTLPGVAKPDEIPKGWGLYEIYSRGVRHIAGAKHNAGLPPHQSNRADEVAIMYSALRRLEIRGVLARVYERI